MSENVVTSALHMDRSEPLGNSAGDDSRRALHILARGGFLGIKGAFTQGRVSQISVNGSGWTAAPTAALATRNTLVIYNPANHDILWNYTNNAAVAIGMVVPAKGYREMLVSDQVTVYLRSTSGTVTITVEELA